MQISSLLVLVVVGKGGWCIVQQALTGWSSALATGFSFVGRHIERPLEATSLDVHDKDLIDEIYTHLMFQTCGALLHAVKPLWTSLQPSDRWEFTQMKSRFHRCTRSHRIMCWYHAKIWYRQDVICMIRHENDSTVAWSPVAVQWPRKILRILIWQYMMVMAMVWCDMKIRAT